MDPVSAMSFAATILQFVEFSYGLVKGSYDIYRSSTGQSADKAHLSVIVDDLKDVTTALQSDNKLDGPHRGPLKKLAADCAAISRELSDILEDLKRKEGNKAWRSLEAKWKGLRKEKKMEDLEARLNSSRIELLIRLNMIIGCVDRCYFSVSKAQSLTCI